jgi:hypothetical protein
VTEIQLNQWLACRLICGLLAPMRLVRALGTNAHRTVCTIRHVSAWVMLIIRLVVLQWAQDGHRPLSIKQCLADRLGKGVGQPAWMIGIILAMAMVAWACSGQGLLQDTRVAPHSPGLLAQPASGSLHPVGAAIWTGLQRETR